MKLADMLLGVAESHNAKVADEEKKRLKWERRKATMRLRRNERWKAAFMQFGGTASTNQLSIALDHAPCVVGATMRSMQKENPPLVEKVGELPTHFNGNPLFVWKWIGE